MKLTKVRITNFQSIRDSTEFEIGDVTCLVGKNEAGKTALLKALYRLNPIRPSDAKFDATHDYPRRDLIDYEQDVAGGTRQHAQVVEATYELEQDDISAIKNAYGEACLINDEATVILSKGYSNEKILSCLTIDEEAALSHIVATFDLPSSLKHTIQNHSTVDAITLIIENNNQSGAPQQLLNRLKAIPEQSIKTEIYKTIIEPNLPKFLYFDEYYQMKGQDNLDSLKQRYDTNSLQETDEPLLGLIKLAGLDLDQLTTPGRTEALIARLEAAENKLTNKVLRYWSQNGHLRMKFDIRPAQPDDPPGMTSGLNILGRVKDTKHMVSTSLGTRSRGFIWFFSFLAWYSQLQKDDENIILLLDEPGLSLHAKAQEDLLYYFEEELIPHHQVIYTTHSPFMVDARHFDRVRIVQDLSVEQYLDDLQDAKQGTQVIADVLDATPDSLFPLQNALGYKIHQTLFIGPNCLVVEGVSDLLYIQAVSTVLERQDRFGLSSEWTITPVGGAANVPTFIALIGARAQMNVAVLIDFHKKDQQWINNIYRNKLLKKRNVLTYAHFIEQDEADVEDMFSPAFYLKIVNGEFKCDIQLDDLSSRNPRIIRRLEEYLADHPLPNKANFNHYRPARYFNEHTDSLVNDLTDEELQRFESVFRELDTLL